MNDRPSVMFFDIETTPNIVTAFSLDNKYGIHYQNIIEERSIICISYKFAGSSEIVSLKVSPLRPKQDKPLLMAFSEAIQKADVIVAHYGDEFDVKFVNGRLVYHSLPPVPNIAQVDTCKIARSKFYFNSNKLDYLAKFLGLGEKVRTDYSLWMSCMQGDPKAINDMVKYNRHDVVLLERVYDRLSPFVKPKIKATTSEYACEHCGFYSLVKASGPRRNLRGWMQRFQCRKCGHWQSKPIKEVKE